MTSSASAREATLGGPGRGLPQRARLLPLSRIEAIEVWTTDRCRQFRSRTLALATSPVSGLHLKPRTSPTIRLSFLNESRVHRDSLCVSALIDKGDQGNSPSTVWAFSLSPGSFTNSSPLAWTILSSFKRSWPLRNAFRSWNHPE